MSPEQVAAASAAFDAEVRAAVLPIVPICEPWRYDGESLEYCVFHKFSTGAVFGASRPGALIFHLTVDWYTPGIPTTDCPDTDPEPRLSALREALSGLGGTWPTVTDASDGAGLHFVLECEVPR